MTRNTSGNLCQSRTVLTKLFKPSLRFCRPEFHNKSVLEGYTNKKTLESTVNGTLIIVSLAALDAEFFYARDIV